MEMDGELAGQWQKPAVHTPDWQSVDTRQACPAAQAPQTPPPQSIAVSLPFFTPSKQLAAWQTPDAQTPEVQSLGAAQCCPTAHAEHVPPPQSVSVS